MLLRRKLCTATAIAIAAVSVFGTGINTVNAHEGINKVTEVSQEISTSSLQDGEYKAKNIIHKDNTGPYRPFFAEETKLVVKEGKYYLTFTNEMSNSVPVIKVKDGDNKITPKMEEIDENTYKFEVELEDLNSKITLLSTMNDMGGMELPFDVSLDMNSIELVKLDEVLTPEQSQPEQSQPEQSESEESTETTEKEEAKYEDGIYSLTNEVIDHHMPSMIRTIFGEETSIEIIEGKIYIIFNIPNYDYVGKVSIKVDGKVVEHTQTNNETDKTATLKFEVPSLDAAMQMTMYSPVTKKDSVFGVKLNKSEMSGITNSGDSNQSTNSTTNTQTNNSNSNTESNSNSTTDNVEEVTVKGKRYTIKNEVTAKSATSKKMGRNFLNETSRIEEVEGKTYAVLTFTGLDMMNNHRIYVDGSKVSHQVVSKSDNSVTIKFLIPSINSDIKVEVYVVPMGFDSEFNVKLLEDTKGAVETFTASSSLPQTGSLLSTEAIMSVGAILSTSGILLSRRKKNN